MSGYDPPNGAGGFRRNGHAHAHAHGIDMNQALDGNATLAMMADQNIYDDNAQASLDHLMGLSPGAAMSLLPTQNTSADGSMNDLNSLESVMGYPGMANDLSLQSFQYDPSHADMQTDMDALAAQVQQHQRDEQQQMQQEQMQQRIQQQHMQQAQRQHLHSQQQQQQHQLQHHMQRQSQQIQQQQQQRADRASRYPTAPFTNGGASAYNPMSAALDLEASGYQTSTVDHNQNMSNIDYSEMTPMFDGSFNTGVVPSNVAHPSALLPPSVPSKRAEDQAGTEFHPDTTRRQSLGTRTTHDSMPNSTSRTPHDHASPASHSKQSLKSQKPSPGFKAQPQNSDHDSHENKAMAAPQPYPPTSESRAAPKSQSLPWPTPGGGWPSTMSGRPHTHTTYKNAYSSSGFDMLSVLTRVAARPNPTINLGSVDMSCSFVVCNAEEEDFPIVYCSDNFERLTGYDKSRVIGRNCRFLQSPTGEIIPGVRRNYVDDDSVVYLKNMISARREAQVSLINYRRGGQPFMNLLTMIPISWDTDQVRFFVGFQIDLVEQPNAVTDKNPDGTYSVNYQRGVAMPKYIMSVPEATNRVDLGQTIAHDDVTTILGTIGAGESEYAKRTWDKILLENTDDVIHVLSLKGLFQWVSPSCQKVLEYEPGELIGTALSSVCHPSDIVPVTRELKDTSSGSPVNVVFRIRRKKSGYMWFEAHGSLHTEQGKGRKTIVMVGRERPVYTLSRTDIVADGGISDSEFWTKMSTSGMFLFVSSNVRQLLDRQPEDLVGVSIQTLMRQESKQDFGLALDQARTGRKASVKHEVINKRGQVLQAMTTLHPGDASEGSKPTFVVAQTRLIKYSRNGSTSRAPKTPVDATSPAGAELPKSSRNSALSLGHQDSSLAAEDNLFDELKTTKSSSWQYEIRQLEKRNRLLGEAVQALLAAKKKRKRRNGVGQLQRDCANCHTRSTPEWRRGPSGQRDLCNSCGLRWAKSVGRVSPRPSSLHSVEYPASDKASRASVSGSPRNSIVKIENVADEAVKTGHAAQMEGAGGVPERIEEGVEPD